MVYALVGPDLIFQLCIAVVSISSLNRLQLVCRDATMSTVQWYSGLGFNRIATGCSEADKAGSNMYA